MAKGKLFVLAGIDGSGKKTQANLLKERLIKEGHLVKLISFP
ncbi:MAG: thymidylate kinase, partial [Candidatus Aenigmarchaeota archaeon]|nr:thymidylate kinase [Candidatus Aenigmarchaeota archaeon]